MIRGRITIQKTTAFGYRLQDDNEIICWSRNKDYPQPNAELEKMERICHCVNNFDKLQAQRDELLEACKKAISISDLWCPDTSDNKFINEHEKNEMMALTQMETKLKQAIDNAEKEGE